jgi:hypothetical protein
MSWRARAKGVLSEKDVERLVFEDRSPEVSETRG